MLIAGRETAAIAFVHRVAPVGFGNADFFFHPDEGADGGIQYEQIDAHPYRQSEDRRRAIQHIAGSHLLRATLMEGFRRPGGPAILAQYAEDGAYGAADVEVR